MEQRNVAAPMTIGDAKPSTVDGPARICVYSEIGWGKTILGCHLPNVVYVGPENGIPRDLGFSVPEIHPRRWLDVFSIVHSLTNDRHDRRSVFFDTLDWIEPLIYRFLIERDSERESELNPYARKYESIEDYGWGKGYTCAEEEMRKLIAVLDEMQYRRGIHVMIAQHDHVKTFKNPDGPDFDRHEPKCHYRVADVVAEWVDNYLFGRFRTDASKISEDKDRNKRDPSKAIAKANPGVSERLVCTQKTAAYDAKNRLRLPAEFPLGDPNELIGILLGENSESLATSQWAMPKDRPVGRHTPYTGPGAEAIRGPLTGSPMPQPGDTIVDRGPETPASSDRPRWGDGQRSTSKPDNGDPFAGQRAAVEQRDQSRRDPAFDEQEAAGRRATSVDPAKTEARNWTEPKPAQPRLDERPSQDSLDIQRVTDMIKTAERGGPEFVAKVKRWANQLNEGNPTTVERGLRIDKLNDFVRGEVDRIEKQKQQSKAPA